MSPRGQQELTSPEALSAPFRLPVSGFPSENISGRLPFFLIPFPPDPCAGICRLEMGFLVALAGSTIKAPSFPGPPPSSVQLGLCSASLGSVWVLPESSLAPAAHPPAGPGGHTLPVAVTGSRVRRSGPLFPFFPSRAPLQGQTFPR